MLTRRDFLKRSGAASVAMAGLGYVGGATPAVAETSDAIYYDMGLNSNDQYDLENVAMAEAQAVDEQIKTAEESMTLLLNDNDALPVAEGSKVTLLGVSTVNEFLARKSVTQTDQVYADWATGQYSDYKPVYRYVEAMQSVYEVNQSVVDAYNANTDTYPGNGVQEGKASSGEQMGAAAGGTVSGMYSEPIDAEAPASFYDDNNLTSTFADYGDAAFVMLTRYGGEDNDLGLANGVGGISELALQPNEVELIEMVKAQKDAGVFKKVIYLINTANQIEIGDLPTKGGADAIMWIGGPGFAGMRGVVRILTGELSPSGHLVDTISTNSLSAPACQNCGETGTGIWENASEILDYVGFTGHESDYSGERNYNAYVIYAEGIYTGYKYYETRYEDAVLGQGNADGSAGVFASSGSWSYADEVSYPFGYGLSYTTFDTKLDSVSFDESSDTYTVTATVTNSGDVAGAHVVQVYAQTPYGDYEKTNGIEKSAIQYVGCGRTQELEPGASETVEISVLRYHLASYDSKTAGGYILSSGDYYLAIGDDAHDALNNVLAAKGATGMVDVLGNAAEGNKDLTYTWNLGSTDTDTYKMSRINSNNRVDNKFEESDFNHWFEDEVTYLSRSDWEGTWPERYAEKSYSCTEEMMEQLKGVYTMPDNAPSVESFTQGVDNGISLIMMRDVDFDDDSAWDDFLDQLTLEDMTYLLNAGTEALDAYGIPAATQIDDGTTIGGSLLAVNGGTSGYEYGNMTGCPISWPCEQNTSACFDPERAQERGRIMGLEAWLTGNNEVWYGGSNMHRTQFCGRNMQYYTEDPVLGYYQGYYETIGMQGVGVAYCGKHFAGNNQEYYRESAASFYNEQTFREGELKCFEGAVADGGCLGIMGGFNRTGLRYCNYYYQLQTGILRDEWGFKGHDTTDAVAGSLFKQNWGLNLVAGTDYFCFNAMLASMSDNPDAVEGITTLIDGGDGYILQCLRQAIKRTCYTWLHTWSINGLSENTKIEKITPWWQTAINAAIGISGVGAAAALGGYLYKNVKDDAPKASAADAKASEGSDE